MADRRPNLLLLLPDQHRWDFNPWNTQVPVQMPNLAQLAAHGVRFDQAIANCPLCAPARASLASGRSYGRCGVVDNRQDFPLDLPTFYQSLQASGYEVCGTGKFDLHKTTPRWNLDGSRLLSEWGFTRGIDNEGKRDGERTYTAHGPQGPYLAYLASLGLADAHSEDFSKRGVVGTSGDSMGETFPTPLPDHAYCDNWIASNTIDVLSQLPEGKPWFCQVNFTGPHEPNDITQSMWDGCQGIDFPLPIDSTRHDADFHNRARQNYSAMLENIDARIGEILAAIEKRGELDNTVIVYSSDHGELLGDHDEWQKSRPWHSSIAVPLVVAGPGAAVGQTSSALVQITDLAATFLDFAAAAPLPDMDSTSFRPVLGDPSLQHRQRVFSALTNAAQQSGNAGADENPKYVWDCIFDGRFKLVRQHGQGLAPQLFDLDEDPSETTDIADARPSLTAELIQLRNDENHRTGLRF